MVAENLEELREEREEEFDLEIESDEDFEDKYLT